MDGNPTMGHSLVRSDPGGMHASLAHVMLVNLVEAVQILGDGGVLTEMYYWCLKATGYGDHLRGVDNGTGQIIERHLIEVDSQPLQFGGKL